MLRESPWPSRVGALMVSDRMLQPSVETHDQRAELR